MVKPIIWSKRAIENKLSILKYWFIRNKSNVYCIKLDKLFDKAALTISHNTSLGRPTDNPSVKRIVVEHYSIFFTESEVAIEILHIWDNRRKQGTSAYRL